MTKRQFIKAVAAGCTVWSGCWLNPEPPVRVGANIWPGYECLFIARSLGLFRDQAVKLVEYPSTPEVIRAFKNRAIEVAALTGDEFIRLAAEDAEVRAILITDFSKGADALVSRTEFQEVKELRGKRIGVEVNALGVYILTRALGCAGLSRNEVEVVPLDNDQHAGAFAQGRVDAVITFEPHRSQLLKSGGRVLFDSTHIPGEVVDYLVTRQSVLAERPRMIRLILESWFKARERLLNDGEEVARLVSARERVTPAEFVRSLELLEIPSREKNQQLLASSGKAADALRKTHAIMLQNGLCRGPLPAVELFNGRFL